MDLRHPFGYKESMDPHALTAASLPQPQSLVGTWRRFGTTGPVYEIIAVGPELAHGDRVMRVRLVETGEEVDYRFAEILDDPKER
jgi:hypothetical protein